MYEITYKIMNGQEVVGYELSDGSPKNKLLSVEQTQGLAIAGMIRNVEYNYKTKRLHGINGNDLRKLAKKQYKIKNRAITESNVYVGNELVQLVNNSTHGYKERFVINKLIKFLDTACNGKICALYGLRRTGKTTMMHHAIKSLIAKNKLKETVYITLTESDTLASLYKQIEKLIKQGKKYVFIDEITALSGFIQSSALLADSYAKQGVHLVIAGTDSLTLELAGRDNLYDRIIKINTTYIGYKEFVYLYPKTSILDYIHHGGVLPADIFYNPAETRRYISTAITDNIINSLIRANNKKEHGHLLELNNRGLLKKAIEQAIEASNEKLTAYVITETYSNKELGSAKQLMEYLFHIDDKLDSEEVEENVRYRLSIVKEFDAEISEEYVDELKEFLDDIGLIKKFKRYVNNSVMQVPIFTQPGLRYNQTIELVNSLYESESYFELPRDIRERFRDKIMQDVEGNLIEHEVLLSLLMKYDNSNVEVTQFNYKGKEVDILCTDGKNTDLYEVKRSEAISEKQYRWLVNTEFNRKIEEMFGGTIRNRVVLYLGKDSTVYLNNIVVQYRNINSFIQSL